MNFRVHTQYFMKPPTFKASHIVKQFGPTIALNDVDIEIYAGAPTDYKVIENGEIVPGASIFGANMCRFCVFLHY